MDPIHLNGLPLSLHTEPAYDSDVEAELEVDQLDSDTDPEVEAVKPNTTKNGSGRPGERVAGHTLLPAVRLENMIQADGVTGNMALSKEGLYVLSIATEEFIKRLIQAGHREASAHRRNQINYTDMAATTQQYQEFMILSETIPAPIPLARALMLREAKERELLEDNPAMALPYSVPSVIPSPDPEAPVALPKPKKSRSSAVNGKEKTNGTASTSTSSKRGSKKPPKTNLQSQDMDTTIAPTPSTTAVAALNGSLEWQAHTGAANGHPSEPVHNRRSARNGLSSASASSSLPPPPANGHAPGMPISDTSQYTPEGGYDIDSLHSPPRDPDSRSQSPPYDHTWPGQFTGPASGFLQGSVVPFGRAPQNPGRTIYSQSHRPD
ncbi:hypothetical protein BDZ97DRAFT_1919179 [Flammula alnicola]|nr:hypothetical protein BDZ97DRAFT_1919179 [Flammula alnicola]